MKNYKTIYLLIYTICLSVAFFFFKLYPTSNKKYVIQTTLMLNSYVQYAVNDPS